MDSVTQMEIVDNVGSTTSYVGTVGTTPIQIPGVAGSNINEMMVHCPTQNPSSVSLFFSFDGVAYHRLAVGESIMWPVKGSKKQIYLKGSGANVEYEMILNTDQAGEI